MPKASLESSEKETYPYYLMFVILVENVICLFLILYVFQSKILYLNINQQIDFLFIKKTNHVENTILEFQIILNISQSCMECNGKYANSLYGC